MHFPIDALNSALCRVRRSLMRKSECEFQILHSESCAHYLVSKTQKSNQTKEWL